MITPKIKDQVLSKITTLSLEVQCRFNPGEQFNTISFNDLNAILKQFQRLGFISDLNSRRSCIHLVVHLESVDFYNRGGFTAQEELLLANINKLQLELKSLAEDLKPKYAEKASTITSVLNNICSCIPLLNCIG